MMKKPGFIGLSALMGMMVLGFSQEREWPEKNFFENSLHRTGRGLAFWYAKEQGAWSG